MKINIWKIMNGTFYCITLLGSVAMILKTDFKSLAPVEVLYVCGSLGGMMYLGEFFRRVMNNDVKKVKSE